MNAQKGRNLTGRSASRPVRRSMDRYLLAKSSFPPGPDRPASVRVVGTLAEELADVREPWTSWRRRRRPES